ncbi:MAG TPA: SusD/RagB family nutrient-binding outer membrane lipoprotein [Bacteroidia bacterium]|nr:SusD/RagB family nutrient-binding outer membrane lipoprotein [Bacteroidia bacterium]
MKLKNLGALILIAVIALTSCKKRFEKLNENPNNPTQVPSQMLFPAIMLSAAQYVELDAGLILCDQWVQHTKSTTYMDEDRYKARADRMDAVWSNLYVGGFEDCVQAIKKAETDNRPNNKAIALVMKAYIGYNLTTLFGDVPYSKAGLGQDGVIAVPYDNQVTVFNSLVSDLDNAISLMDPNSPYIISDQLSKYDVIYAGDMVKWKKFANGLKIRIYLTMTAGGTNKVAAINTIIASGDVFSSSADDAALHYLSSPSTNSNPIYQWVNPLSDRRDDYRMSQTLVNYMMGSSVDSANPVDLRLKVYADTVAGGKYVGGQNGVTGGQAENSMLGMNFYKPTEPFYFMSYTELLFIQAELDTTIQVNYENAVRASFAQNGLTVTDANNALADPKFAYNSAKSGRLIGEQKWVALFGQGAEAFTSWRRTGYPKFTPASSAATVTGFVPRRIAYNSDEKSLNSANVNTGIQGLTPADDRISSKVWFDRNHADNFGNQ